ncbi:MFS transporter [Nocardiopsis kunsanensis]|uniref:MFS transporter n=1 Tax=Nocardiopsis kunsanensis TaxID=141693 RepID=A0A918X9I7_9ACTN|nr:MFS transporter [Nocardiopsis kunsanensis]GHD19673.1 MFS transporter [Nocardiopsis kunsanensis]
MPAGDQKDLHAHPVHARLQRLTRPLYAYAVCQELILLYPVYTLLFAHHGLSTTQISSLFVIWSLTSVLLALPTGTWADLVPRRHLLALGPLLTGTGFTLWLLAPSYPAFAAGFVLWGTGSTLVSGTLEALVRTELDHRGAPDHYTRLMGRTSALEVASAGTATLLAVPAMAHGGYTTVGAASVTVCALGALTALALPEQRPTTTPDQNPHPDPGYTATLRAGLHQARTSRPVRSALLLLVVATVFWQSLEEYIPLLASDSGVAPATVPAVMLLVWAFVTIGGLTAARAARWPRPLLGLGTDAVAIGTYAGYAGLITGLGHPAVFTLFMLPYAAVGLTMLAPARNTT